MTERSWLGATRPYQMLAYLGKSISARKARLVGVAACHRLWDTLTDPRSQYAVTVAEQFAEGIASETELFGAHTAGQAVVGWLFRGLVGSVSAPPDEFMLANVLSYAATSEQHRDSRRAHCDFLRDVFGNPFRPVAFDPAWRTDTAVALARQMYDSRDFGAMPILADALQDAGCEDEVILAHCREPGLHVRGCWVCDLVLGKA